VGAPDHGRVRLAELVAALSLGIDLGFDQPMEHVLRQCLIALRLAERVGVDEQARVAVYYTALLVNVGCHSDAHEQAKWFGDDIALKADKYAYGLNIAQDALATIRRFASGTDGVVDKVRLAAEFAVSGRHELDAMITHHSEMARRLGEDLGLAPDILDSLDASYEQWDGRGWPGVLRGDAVPIAARLAAIGEYVEVAHRVGGVDAALALVRAQRGKQFDPHLADMFEAQADMLLSDLDEVSTWDAVIGAEPALCVMLTEDRFDEALLAIADFVDLKSTYSLGHARAVADLVAAAGRHLGLPDDEVRTLRRAGLVHCFGKLGVSNAILDKRSPLTAGERERLHMVPYLTHRMLRQSPLLRPLGDIAAVYGERLDGSGFPHGLSGSSISGPGRLLAAAHAYQSMREPRPRREPHSAADAGARLRAESRAGRLDLAAVEAVLAAAGHRPARRRPGPAGLTAREVDVLALLARGLTNKDIAARLVISRKTVANHVEHIYSKIGVSTRTAAALFATRHGLLTPEEPVPV
jgi:HD-GYP domain-containing protein (c-di-GMP phosphodiesterase class II)